MVGYSVVEKAIVQQLLSHFSDEVNEERCKAADIDSVFLAMRNEDSIYGCVIDYADGRRMSRPPFGNDAWTWQIVGTFLLRFTGDVTEHDATARALIDKLVHLFDNDKRLGGLVPLVQVTQIGRPEPETVNEVPMYWIPFSIEVVDK